jgi:hypothetical protein
VSVLHSLATTESQADFSIDKYWLLYASVHDEVESSLFNLSNQLKKQLEAVILDDEIISLAIYCAALFYILSLHFIFWKIQQGLIDGAMHNRSIVYMIPHGVAKKSKTVQRYVDRIYSECV